MIGQQHPAIQDSSFINTIMIDIVNVINGAVDITTIIARSDKVIMEFDYLTTRMHITIIYIVI